MRRITWFVLVSFIFSSSVSFAQPAQNFSPPQTESSLIPAARTFTFAGRSYPAAQALARPIDPDQYQIGPGDGLQIQIWGGVDLLYEVIVTAEGRVVIPTIGTLDVKEKSLRAVQEVIAREAAHYYRGANIAVSLAVLRAFEVFVLGEVAKPGIYAATPVTRVTELLNQAGGVAPTGSLRRIEIRREGSAVINVDVSRFLHDGRLDQNPYLSEGSTVFVPLNEGSVLIEGAVQRPTTYTLRAGDTVQSLIDAAGGLSPDADPARLTLHRNDRPVAGADGQATVQDGDRITIPNGEGRIAPIPVVEGQVYVVGFVDKPGPYPYQRNRSVMDYIGLAGGGDARARLSGAVVYRRQQEIAARKVAAVQPGDMIEVPEKRLKWWQDYVTILTAVSSVVLSAIAVSLASRK